MNKRIVVLFVLSGLVLLSVGCAARSSVAEETTALTGTWHVTVAESTGGMPDFEAYHTFHGDGTMTEVSSLLPTLTESPAHGAWAKAGDSYDVTFEPFTLNEAGEQDSRIWVRMIVTLDEVDHFTGNADVDLLLPGGAVERGIDSLPVAGTRVKVK